MQQTTMSMHNNNKQNGGAPNGSSLVNAQPPSNVSGKNFGFLHAKYIFRLTISKSLLLANIFLK